ncbi:hypothetical protein Ahy_A10g048014 isoform D [Arachis hypogaea]|uniref:Uncharacterized protein n=1 Tax=Arachis hypogaea TaxID=3818 RepID=A0A445B437_ARAHY|nr:hypothetical protein Ahy_A10g048014 isoform D [Arachis hypogaea]
MTSFRGTLLSLSTEVLLRNLRILYTCSAIIENVPRHSLYPTDLLSALSGGDRTNQELSKI